MHERERESNEEEVAKRGTVYVCNIYIYERERDEEEVVYTNTTCKWTVYLSLKLLCLAL